MSETLLIQGDSLPLPRQRISYADTWPARLRASSPFSDVINRSRSGKTTDDLHRDNVRFPRRSLEAYDPDTVVLQIGIVDCAPRLLSQTEKDLLTACPFDRLSHFGGHFLKWARDRSRDRTYVSDGDFEANVRHFLDRAEQIDVDEVVVLKILTAGEKYTAKNPEVQSAISAYNDRLDAVAADYPVVETMRPLAPTESEEAAIVDDHTLDDGYHLDAAGHERLYDRLLDAITTVPQADTRSTTVD